MKKLIQKGKGALRKRVNKYKTKVNILPKPVFISIAPSNRCNLTCKMCEIWKIKFRDKRPELTNKEMKKTILDLKKWLGTFDLNLAGGEPFMRPDMIDIMKYAAELGLNVYTTSNGVMFNKKKCDELVEAGVRGISISLDSLDPEIHNHIRNTKTGFNKTMENIKYLNKIRDNKMDLNLATVFMGYNLESILPLVDFVEKNKLTGINFQPLIHNFGTEYTPQWFKKSEFWPKPEQLDRIDEVLDELIKRKKAGAPLHNPIKQFEVMKKYFRNPLAHAKKVCNVGTKNFAISEYGEVLICYFFKPIGNIKDTKPEVLWKSKAAQDMRKRIKVCKRNCDLLNCNFD